MIDTKEYSGKLKIKLHEAFFFNVTKKNKVVAERLVDKRL